MWRLKAGVAEVSRYSSPISAKDFDRGGSEAAEGKRAENKCACVSMKERETGGGGGVRGVRKLRS